MNSKIKYFFIESQENEPRLNEIEVEHHPDCPVCLQSSNYPVQLPCGHIFCYLCIKGVALRSRRCALCRQDITVDCIENPTLVKPVNTHKDKERRNEQSDEDQRFVWYYEGRNGWWQYDEKTSSEVEKAFKSGKRSCQLLIAGFLYLIDFESMFQMRRNEPGRMRRIKRDKPDAERKGVAGIRLRGKAKPKSPTRVTKTEKSEKSNNSTSSNDSHSGIKNSSNADENYAQCKEGNQDTLGQDEQNTRQPSLADANSSSLEKQKNTTDESDSVHNGSSD